MGIRCSIDIEAADCNELRRILGPAVETPAATRLSDAEALAQVCLSLATNRVKRNKIEAIKMVRTLTGLGLKEAKDAVETLDCEYLFGSNGGFP